MGVLKQVGPMHRVPTCCLCRSPWIHSDALSCASPLYPSELITSPSFWCPCLVVSTGLVVPCLDSWHILGGELWWSGHHQRSELILSAAGVTATSGHAAHLDSTLGVGHHCNPCLRFFPGYGWVNLVPCFGMEWEGPDFSLRLRLGSDFVVVGKQAVSSADLSPHCLASKSHCLSQLIIQSSLHHSHPVLEQILRPGGPVRGLSECVKRWTVME